MKENKPATAPKVKSLEECISSDEFNGVPGSYIYDPVTGTRTRVPDETAPAPPIEN